MDTNVGRIQGDSVIGSTYGRLRVLGKESPSKGYTMVKCLCSCGNTIVSRLSHIKTGNTKSCGCLRKEQPNGATHRFSYTRFYKILTAMKQRCYNEKTSKYQSYGGRGIKICDRWLESFTNFKEDMYESYLEHCEKYGIKNTTIDRIDVNGNYELNNCRWATYLEQMNNTSTLKLFKATDPYGNIYIENNQSDFSRKHDLCSKSVNRILRGGRKSHRGWKFEYVHIKEDETNDKKIS